eukprot:4861118-Prymnesium_polylepis.3
MPHHTRYNLSYKRLCLSWTLPRVRGSPAGDQQSSVQAQMRGRTHAQPVTDYFTIQWALASASRAHQRSAPSRDVGLGRLDTGV